MDSRDTMLVKDAQAAVEAVLRKLQAAEVHIATLEGELQKARFAAPVDPKHPVAPVLKGLIDSSMAERRKTTVRKSSTDELSDHYHSDKIAKRRADERAELQCIADEGARATMDALRNKAGLR